MSSEGCFIINNDYGGDRHRYRWTTDRIVVTHPERTRVKKVHNVGGMRMRELESTGGRDRQWLKLNGPGAVDASGQRRQAAASCATTAKDLKGVLRRVRPQEAETIDRIDNEITATLDRLAQLRRDRAEAVDEAWRRGHVVRLNEVQPEAGEHTRRVGNWEDGKPR